MKEMHVYGQPHEHEEVFIVGNREALEELRDRLTQVLECPAPAESKVLAFAGDGEGFEIRVALIGDRELKDWLLPYFDETALDRRKDVRKPWEGVAKEEQR